MVPFDGLIWGVKAGKTINFFHAPFYSNLKSAVMFYFSCYKPRCREDIIVFCQRAVTALALSPTASYQLAIGCADSSVRIYDRRCLSTQSGGKVLGLYWNGLTVLLFIDHIQPFCTFVAPHFGNDRHYRITSLSYSRDGQDMLVSYSSDYLYLFSVLVRYFN